MWLAGLVYACAVCATADPTLTSSGEEQPFRNRLEITADARVGRVDAGGVTLDDRRVEIATAWSPTRTLAITFLVPYLFRTIAIGPTAFDRATLGDVELRGQAFAYEARGAFGHRRLGIVFSAKAPTAPIERDENGVPLSSVLQPGCGAFSPSVGAFWTASRAMWSYAISASLLVPISVRSGPHAGDSLRASAHVQIQPSPAFAARLGAFARVDSSGNLDATTDDPNSGGFVGYLTAALVVSPATDVVVTAGLFLPVVEALRGDHHESAIGALTVAYDF